MTDTVQEFKVGDKVKYKSTGFPESNNHIRDKVYTVSAVELTQGWLIFEEGGWPVLSMWIEKYTPQPQKHIHHDLIVAWAKDPKGCVIQWYDPHLVKWLSCNENKPSWVAELNYRIKPKTKEVTRWKWVLKVVDGYEVTNAYYTEDEAKKHFDKPLHKIEDSVVTDIEEI